jgi:hypothetical protein
MGIHMLQAAKTELHLSIISQEPNSGMAPGLLCKEGFVSHSRRYLLLSLALMLVFFAANPSNYLYGQDFRASITGQVADSTGAVIPGASITAVNVETQLTYPTKSDKQGAYSLLYMLPGTYTVTVEAGQFQTMVYNSVRLNSGQQLGLNVTLEPGSVAEQIVV